MQVNKYFNMALLNCMVNYMQWKAKHHDCYAMQYLETSASFGLIEK